MSIDGSGMLLVVMVASVLAVVLGLEKSASVIFEADALYPSSAKMNVEAVQHIKRQKVMPKLWAPMLESFIGEAILFLVLFSGSVAGDGWNILVWIIGFNLLVIIFLGQYFYKAGRPGDAFDEIR